ncbi:tRNA pseudouridine(13) synthase TruD [Candidatus Micrarchaeota archaeon]|nr:tRNA pseudouridine(13) synthase TruD [Candidatus Micrarchaeota archaeon]
MHLHYLSKFSGIGGQIKQSPEDFLVEEISQNGTIFELDKTFEFPDTDAGKFLHFILQKRDWSNSSAISEISDRLHINPRNFNFAGNKDKIAITTGLFSVSGISRERLLSLNIKDLKINGIYSAPDRVSLGDLCGNRFTITIRNPTDSSGSRVNDIYSSLEGKFPNYFGEQRFGSSRKNTAQMGLYILKREYSEAVLNFLCNCEGEQNQEATLARKELESSMDFTRALRYFPKHLRLERTLLEALSKNPKDFKSALRILPRNILLLFIHAFQSKIFNDLLSRRLSESFFELEDGEFFCDISALGFPDLTVPAAQGLQVGKIIGYQSILNDRERAYFESLGLSHSDFRMSDFPEISSKGARRLLFAPLLNFSFSENVFRFTLPSGSYATSALREFMDHKIISLQKSDVLLEAD